MSLLQRTNSIFTKGIVNVPLTTPAEMIFLCDSIERQNLVTYILGKMNIEYNMKPHPLRKGEVKIRTTREIQITEQKALFHFLAELKKERRIKRVTAWRYPMFETDDKTKEHFDIMLEHYKVWNIPVYYHESMRGWHWLSVKPMHQSSYETFINEIKYINPDCPLTTIRIKPNKWIDEDKIWHNSAWWMNDKHSDTYRLAAAMRIEDYDYLSKHYSIENYRIGAMCECGEMMELIQTNEGGIYSCPIHGLQCKESQIKDYPEAWKK